MKKKKDDSKKDVLVLLLYLFLSCTIPPTAITIFANADKNIQAKREIIDNNKQTNAANFDKEEVLQKIITLLLKGTSSSKYSGSKVDLDISCLFKNLLIFLVFNASSTINNLNSVL